MSDLPRFNIANTTGARARLRTSTGLVTLMPRQAGPADGYEMAPALALYYERAGLTVKPMNEAAAEKVSKGGDAQKLDLYALDAAATLATAAAEKIDLGDLDLADAADLATAHATIHEFRRIYESGNADMLRSEAEKIEAIDADALKAATTKYAVVNLIIAAQGVPGA